MGKQVPLVMYKGGDRIILGMASISEDGTITGLVKRDHREFVKGVIGENLGEIALNPKPAVEVTRYDQVAQITTEIHQ